MSKLPRNIKPQQNISWETLATPFRVYAKQKGLTNKDILNAVEGDRRTRTSR